MFFYLHTRRSLQPFIRLLFWLIDLCHLFAGKQPERQGLQPHDALAHHAEDRKDVCGQDRDDRIPAPRAVQIDRPSLNNNNYASAERLVAVM
jgi:hypothetical protein